MTSHASRTALPVRVEIWRFEDLLQQHDEDQIRKLAGIAGLEPALKEVRRLLVSLRIVRRVPKL